MTTTRIKYMDSAAIAKLAGSGNKNFALTKMRTDPTFPRHVSGGGVGNERRMWRTSEVKAWLAAYRKGDTSAYFRVPVLDNAMAAQIIRRGWLRGGRAIAHMQINEVHDGR